jgi:hypothetical protein
VRLSTSNPLCDCVSLRRHTYNLVFNLTRVRRIDTKS